MHHHFNPGGTVLPIYGQTQIKGSGRDRSPSALEDWDHTVFRTHMHSHGICKVIVSVRDVCTLWFDVALFAECQEQSHFSRLFHRLQYEHKPTNVSGGSSHS